MTPADPPPLAFSSPVLVLDMGGTRIKAGTTLHRRRPLFDTPTPRDTGQALKVLTDLAKRVLGSLKETGLSAQYVVCGAGGLITPSGRCERALYTPLAGVELADELRVRLGMDACVLNDASLQAHGVRHVAKNSLLLSIGTGVGGAITIDGTVISGAHGFAGEIGHAVARYSDIACRCGRVGCLDTVASGAAFDRDLGAEWFLQRDSAPEDKLRRLAASVADTAIACARILDVDTIAFSGWPARYDTVRGTCRRAIQTHWASIRLMFFANAWALSVRGANAIGAGNRRLI